MGRFFIPPNGVCGLTVCKPTLQYFNSLLQPTYASLLVIKLFVQPRNGFILHSGNRFKIVQAFFHLFLLHGGRN